MTPLPRLARWIIARFVPAEWRESIEGDLVEERSERVVRGQSGGWIWASIAAVVVATRVSADRRRQFRDSQRWWFRIRRDFRDAVRTLSKERSYAIATVLTLALGIGANTTLFTFANWLLYRPLPGVREPGRLLTIGFGNADGTRLLTAMPDFQLLAASPALADVTGYHVTAAHVAPANAPAMRVYAEAVTARYFDVLARPALGRGFSAAEGTDVSLPPVAVLSDRLWRREFAADPQIIGRTIVVNRREVGVIGIAPPGFHGPSLTAATDIWVPIAQHRLVLPMYPDTAMTARRPPLLMGLIGRLAAGATAEDVAAQLEVIRAQIASANPGDVRISRWRFVVSPGVEANHWQRGQLEQAFAILMGMAAVLLVLTCTNAGQLMMARATARGGEMAIRLALGSSRAGIARLVLVESLVISFMAAVVAIGLAALMAWLAQGTFLLHNVPPLDRVAVDGRVFLYTLIAALAVAGTAAVLPMLGIGRVEITTSLRHAARSHSLTRPVLRRALAGAQVVLSLTLVVAAALLTRSMAARLHIDPGFDPSRVLTLSIDPAVQHYGKDRPALFAEILNNVRRVAGVRAAAASWLRPSFHGIAADTAFQADGSPANSPSFDAETNQVTPGYFAAIGLPIVEGRDFLETESGPEAAALCRCVVLTESLARRVFGSTPAVGKSIREREQPPATVIGVVRDTRQRNLITSSPDMMFLPFRPQATIGFASIVVGLAAPADAVVPGIRRAIADIDPTLPVYDVARVDDAIRRQFADDLLLMHLARTFAALATIVAAIGLAGVLARTLAERRRELGIRVALGATPAGVARVVAKEAAVVLVVGIPLGLAASWGLAGLLTSHLFGVSSTDPLSFAAGILIVLAVMTACAVPSARRASRLDPTLAMRE